MTILNVKRWFWRSSKYVLRFKRIFVSHVTAFNVKIISLKSGDHFYDQKKFCRSRDCLQLLNLVTKITSLFSSVEWNFEGYLTLLNIIAFTWPYLRFKCCSESHVTIFSLEKNFWRVRDYFYFKFFCFDICKLLKWPPLSWQRH